MLGRWKVAGLTAYLQLAEPMSSRQRCLGILQKLEILVRLCSESVAWRYKKVEKAI